MDSYSSMTHNAYKVMLAITELFVYLLNDHTIVIVIGTLFHIYDWINHEFGQNYYNIYTCFCNCCVMSHDGHKLFK